MLEPPFVGSPQDKGVTLDKILRRGPAEFPSQP